MKVYMGRAGIAPLIIIGVGCELLASRLDHLTPKKEPRYPTNRRLGGPQNRSGWLAGEENCLFLLGFELRTVQLDWGCVDYSQRLISCKHKRIMRGHTDVTPCPSVCWYTDYLDPEEASRNLLRNAVNYIPLYKNLFEYLQQKYLCQSLVRTGAVSGWAVTEIYVLIPV